MEFKDVIYGRRSVRKYNDKEIDIDTLKEIVDAGLWAPSGVNLQPWYLVAIHSKEKLARFKELMAEVSRQNEENLKNRFANNPDVARDSINFIATLGNAPCVILIFRKETDYSWVSTDEGIVQSMSAAAENIVLSAYDHGLSSCWMLAPSRSTIKDVFRDEFAPGHGDILCAIALGYSDEKPKAPKRKEGRMVIL